MKKVVLNVENYDDGLYIEWGHFCFGRIGFKEGAFIMPEIPGMNELLENWGFNDHDFDEKQRWAAICAYDKACKDMAEKNNLEYNSVMPHSFELSEKPFTVQEDGSIIVNGTYIFK
jgi:hypothetical protein